MHTLKLSDEEKDLLCELLECHIRDLRSEIHDTNDCDFKTMLKEKRQMLMQLLEKVHD
jgi:hypothetical protein